MNFAVKSLIGAALLCLAPAEKLKAGDEGKWQEGLTSADIEERFRKLVTDAGGDLRSLEFGVKSGGEERRLKATLKKKAGGK
jgi:hypothetical protein